MDLASGSHEALCARGVARDREGIVLGRATNLRAVLSLTILPQKSLGTLFDSKRGVDSPKRYRDSANI